MAMINKCNHRMRQGMLWCNRPWTWRQRFIGEDLYTKVTVNDKVFYFRILHNDSSAGVPASQISTILERCYQALKIVDHSADLACRLELQALICDASAEIFQHMAPELPENLSQTLHSVLNPESFYFNVTQTQDNMCHLEKRERQPQDDYEQFDLTEPIRWCSLGHLTSRPCIRPTLPDRHVVLPLDAAPDIPTYLDKEITILERLRGISITRVVIPKTGSDRGMVCKVAINDMTDAAVFRELQCLLMLAALSPDTIGPGTPLARIPKLLGVVRSSDDGRVVGLVETFVPHSHVSDEGEGDNNNQSTPQTLTDMNLTKVGVARRKKWICQIDETMAALHKVGITWGDVKADNVLIHSVTDDAWLIDFGGSCTVDWGDSDKAETIDEDLAVGRKLADYLSLGKQYSIIQEN